MENKLYGLTTPSPTCEPIAIQVLKTLARRVRPGEGEGGATQRTGEHPPMIRLRARNHRVFFRDRVLDRNEAYR